VQTRQRQTNAGIAVAVSERVKIFGDNSSEITREQIIVRVGQGAFLLETRGWDDLASGIIEASYSWSSSFLTAAIWRSSNSVKRRPRQRSAARISAPNMSLSTGFSPKPLGMIFSHLRSSTNSRSRRSV
jgi:hypothetical protein